MAAARILVVEDELIVSMDIQNRLSGLGYEVVGAAAEGAQAVAQAGELRPDLVLMDIQLGGKMDGIEAAEQIHQRLGAPVVFLTAFSEDHTLERAKSANPFGYILKPFEDRELKSTLEIALYKHRTEVEVRRLNRVYAALSQVNQSVARARAREELLQEVCRVVVEFGQFRLAWIGWLDPSTKAIRPVAQAGAPHDYVRKIKVSAEDRPEGRGPVGVALREGKPQVWNHFLEDPRSAPWRGAATEEGLRACAAFPVRLKGEVVGVLAVYATEPDFFQDKEITLLQEAAMDISFGLDHLAAKQELERTAREWQATFDATNDTIWILDQDYRVVRSNRTAERFFHHSRGEMLGRHCWAIVQGAAQPHPQCPALRARQSGRRETLDLPRGDRWLEVIADPIFDAAGEYQGAVYIVSDITERKRAEAQLRDQNAELEAALAKVKLLSGLVPICAGCKKIRDDQGYWSQVEVYIQKHSEATFTHGLCPDCSKKYFPGIRVDADGS
jgi:PAS domain S-box-containing protein